MLLFPSVLFSWLSRNFPESMFWNSLSQSFQRGDSYIYNMLYIGLIYFFCYFWTAVTFNPKATYDNQKPPSDLDEAFAKRYLLVTPETVEQTAKEFPNLFMGMMPPGGR